MSKRVFELNASAMKAEGVNEVMRDVITEHREANMGYDDYEQYESSYFYAYGVLVGLAAGLVLYCYEFAFEIRDADDIAELMDDEYRRMTHMSLIDITPLMEDLIRKFADKCVIKYGEYRNTEED